MQGLGRQKGTHDDFWPDRIMTLLAAIESMQFQQHTVSLRELERACGVCRQTISNWLRIAEDLGYVDMHGSQPRAMELLPEGQRLVRQFRSFHDVDKWKRMRRKMKRSFSLTNPTA